MRETTITPYLCIKGAADAIEFYQRAFGAVEVSRSAAADGHIGHAELQIGGAPFMLSDEWPEGGVYSPATLGGAAAALVVIVPNVDEFFAQAVAAGATLQRPVEDQGHGLRSGWLIDPFGFRWNIGTPIPRD